MTPTQRENAPAQPGKPCNICGHGNPALHLVKQGFEILRCPECGLQYLNIQPTARELETLYGPGYFESDQCADGYGNYFANQTHLKRNFTKRAALIQRYKSGGRLLDAGCGPGFFLEILPGNWSGCGIEVSEYAVSKAAARGLDVKQGSLLEADYPQESFDAVCLWDVLEHVDDPARALSRAASLLKPGGILAISTGDALSFTARVSGSRWHLYTLPEHLFFFSRPALSRLLDQSGFSLEIVLYETLDYSLGYLVERLFKMLGFSAPGRLVPGAVSRILHRLIIPVNLFDIMTVIARKK